MAQPLWKNSKAVPQKMKHGIIVLSSNSTSAEIPKKT